jgi:hypothetical protein
MNVTKLVYFVLGLHHGLPHSLRLVGKASAGASNTKPKLKPIHYNQNPPFLALPCLALPWPLALSKLFFDDSFVISLSSLPFPFSVLTKR